MSTKKTVLCFSGGLDSTVLLYHLLNLGYDVCCLSVNYGQRHKLELRKGVEITRLLKVTHRIVELGPSVDALFRGSSQTDVSIDVPEGHYAEESMKATVVPNRNMVLLSLATAWAVSLKAQYVAYAAHAGDHAVYPDCRPDFAAAMDSAIAHCDWNPPRLLRPFAVGIDKAAIVKLGGNLGVPFEKTYSCYKGGEKHCGLCGTCRERIEAFQLAEVPDPTQYDTGIRKYGGKLDTEIPSG